MPELRSKPKWLCFCEELSEQHKVKWALQRFFCGGGGLTHACFVIFFQASFLYKRNPRDYISFFQMITSQMWRLAQSCPAQSSYSRQREENSPLPHSHDTLCLPPQKICISIFSIVSRKIENKARAKFWSRKTKCIMGNVEVADGTCGVVAARIREQNHEHTTQPKHIRDMWAPPFRPCINIDAYAPTTF